MTDGFQVTMSNLLTAARAFHSEAAGFSGTMPATGPAPADGGGWAINDALSLACESVGLLHAQLAATITGDAASLEANYQEYAYAEHANTRLVTGVTVDPAKARHNP